MNEPNTAEPMTRAEAHHATLTIAYTAVLDARTELLKSYEYSEADRAKALFWLEQVIGNLRQQLAIVGRL